MPHLSVRRIWIVLIGLSIFAPPVLSVTKSTQKVFAEVRSDQALVYFVRQPRFQGSGRTVFIYADETFVGVVDNNSYTFAYLEPGDHLLWLNWARINSEVELTAGKVYYFDVWTSFNELDEESGRLLIQGVKFYTTPEAKETATSGKHIQKRYSKAERFAEKPKKEYIGTKSKREEHVNRWARVDLASYPVLYVEDFHVTDPKAAKRKKAYLIESLPRRLADDVVEKLGEGVFDAVRRQGADEDAEGAVVVKVQITQYKPGSDTARLMVAGAGSAHLDFAVQLLDAQDQKELTRFTGQRTWAWGGAAGASRGISELEQNVAYEIALYLKRCKMGQDAQIEEEDQ